MKFSVNAWAVAGAVGLAFCSVASASAATVTVKATADLTLAPIVDNRIYAGRHANELDALPLIPQTVVAKDDTFIYELDFLGNQILTIENLDIAWATVETNDGPISSNVTMTGTLDFLGLDGSVVLSRGPKSDTAGFYAVGQNFFAADLGAIPSITFAGFRYTGVVHGYQNRDSRIVDAPAMFFRGTSITVGEGRLPGGGVVPEPGTWALMIAGFGTAGAVLRRPRTFPA